MKDGEGNSLWELTWHKARAVSSGLTPALLQSAGVGPSIREPASPSATQNPRPAVDESARADESPSAAADPQGPQLDERSRAAGPGADAASAARPFSSQQDAGQYDRQADGLSARHGDDSIAEGRAFAPL